MKPMTTISFPTGEYKLVPVEPNESQCDEGAQAIVQWENGAIWPESWGSDAVRYRKDCRKAYLSMLSAVPDQLPGVVVHSGEPVGEVIETDKLCRGFIIEEVPAGTKLFTHPAPSQPSTEALVQAALEAAAKYCMGLLLPNPDKLSEISNYNRGRVSIAFAIRALDKQQIIKSCKEKS